jgi:ACDE family multidrug resistance protein
MVVARGLPSVVWFGFLTYNSIVIVRLLGSSPAVAGLLTSLGSLAFAVPATQAGRITERFDSRFYPLVVANVALTVGFAVFVLTPSLPGAVLGVVLLGLGEGVTMSIYRSIISTLPPQSLRGGLVSLAESVGWIASTLTPVAMGAAIAAATPLIGFGPAVKLTVVATGLVAGLGGIGCLAVVRVAGPVSMDA